MAWQKVIGFLGKKDKNSSRDAFKAQLSKRSFEESYRTWLIEECTYLTDVPIGPVNGFPELPELYCQASLEELEPPYTLPQQAETPSATKSINDAMALHKQLLITAPSGYGKTTLCRFLALRAASFKSDSEEETLAFFIPLKLLNHTEHLDIPENTLTIDKIIKLALPEHLAVSEQAQKLVEEKLAASKCLFLFDGLDDIVYDDIQQEAFTTIEDFARKHSNHYVVITSNQPIHSEMYSDTRFATYALLPLSTTGIEHYVNKHFKYLANGVALDNSLDAQDFIQKVESNPKIAELCQNPMMLCMLLALYTDKVALETETAALFESYLKQSLLWYTPEGCHPSQWGFALERIAYTIHKNNALYIQSNWCKKILMSELDNLGHPLTPDELDTLLDACENKHSIFISDGLSTNYENNILEFSHKSFQDFYIAKQLHHKGQDGLIHLKSSGLKLRDQGQHGVLMFYALLAKDTSIKADELIYWLLSLTENKEQALFFASNVALQSNTLSNIVVERIQDNLESLITLNNSPINAMAKVALEKLTDKYRIQREVILTHS